MIAAAERILSGTLGGPVRLDRAQMLRGSDRSRVVRCPVLEGPEGAPASIILKHVPGDPEHPYDPDHAPPFSPAWRFFNDWTGAQFLSGVSSEPLVCPRFYGGDRATGFVLLEDLGEGESLADLLLGEDPTRAEEGLMAHATTLGRMHAATVGRQTEYQQLRDALVSRSPEDGATSGTPYAGFREGCDALGYTPGSEFEVALQVVSAAMREPGPFLAYTHGDPCPDNDRCIDGSLRLFDFEFGAFRHALRDGVYGRVPFPTCWCLNRLPAAIPPRMEAVYRAELVKGCPEAGDDTLFHRAVVEASAHWIIETTGWHLRNALKEDERWGVATLRQRLLLRLENLAALTGEFAYLEPLGTTAADLAARLRALWPPEADQMPLYPAFRESGSASS
jgi:hypothetical protein